MSAPSEALAANPPHFAQLRSALVAWEEYRAANAHIFPSAESWRWFFRQHKGELTQRGAVVFLAGKLLVKPEVMAAALEEIGQRLAKGRAA